MKKMKTDREIGEMDDMEVVIRSHGDFAYGSEKVEDIAQEWRDYNFTPEEADEWLKAGCFRASDARALADIDITPKKASLDTNEGIGGYTASIGYKFSNNDLTIDQVQEILGVE
jgi:hypothetical protein